MTTTPRYCRSCSYDLRAQFPTQDSPTTSPSPGIISPGPEPTPRCPECGRPFNPANPKTFAKRPRRTGLRRWSLRLALSLILLALALAGSWYYLYRGYQREQAAAKSLEPFGVYLTYEPLGGRKFQHALGRAGFVLDRAHVAQFSYQRTKPCNLSPLKEFTRLDSVEITCYVEDSELRDIAQCKNLKILEIKGSEHTLTDAGLAELRSLPHLQSLSLRACDKITDAGLDHLHHIPTLRTIILEDNDRLTPAALKALQSALPAAKITGP